MLICTCQPNAFTRFDKGSIIAMDVGADLFRQVETSGARLVACDSETCRWQIEHGTRRPSAHPIELLHRAYRL